MPALSYSNKNIELYDFENKILNGIKIHTIRRYRKRKFKIGDILYHYKNWRTSRVKKIIENTCLYVADIEIQNERVNLASPHRTIHEFGFFDIFINDKEIKDYEGKNKLAINDGFDNLDDFKMCFINFGLPFYGQIIGWKEGINYE